MATPQEVIDALKKVKFPGLSRDIVSFGFVHDVKVQDGVVSFVIRFQTENPNVGNQLVRDSEAAGHRAGKASARPRDRPGATGPRTNAI